MTESSSLCAALRSAADRMRGWTYSGDSEPDPRALMREAAAEIERLKAESDTLADALNGATVALADVGADL